MQQKRQTIPVQQAECRVREALPLDIPALMRLKRALAAGEDGLHVVRASEADWLRDGFGPHAGFTAFVAEDAAAGAVIGMATCSQRIVTGWNGPVMFLQDLFVEPAHRARGIADALVARVAALANELGSPIVELTVRADNPSAQRFYQRNGFQPVPQCLTYVLAGPALVELAQISQQQDQDQSQEQSDELPLAG
jgi:ribosomal protein S18 acetylase RimI-like enzyme